MLQLRDYQQELVNNTVQALNEGHRNILNVASTGCHAKGSRVLMYSGALKNVEDITVGELLMGPDNLPRTVLERKHGYDDMYKVTPVKGKSFVVNGGHVLCLKDTVKGVITNISVNDYLRKSSTFKHRNKLWKPERINIPHYRHKHKISPYFLGVLIGDGSIVNRLTVTTPDMEIVNECVLQSINFNCSLTTQQGRSCFEISFSRKVGDQQTNRLKDALRELNLLGLKSGKKFIPNSYKFHNEDTLKELLAGLIDTDGYVYNNCCEYVTKSKLLADDIEFICNCLGIRCTRAIKTVDGVDYQRLNLSGDLSIIPTKVKRKQFTKRQQKKSVLRTGFSVEKVGYDKYFGFLLSDDHLYLDDQFFVHHNSGKTASFVGLSDILARNMGQDEFILVLSHLSILTEQTGESYEKFSDLNVGVLQAERVPNYNCNVVISTVQSSSDEDKMLEYIIMAEKKPRYIIVDESHRRFTSQYSKVFDMFPDAQCIDFTATPFKNRQLATGFYDKVAFQISMQDLIDRGYLVPPMLKQIKFDSMEDSALKCSLVLNLYKEHETGKSSIVFMRTKEECKLMCDVFTQNNIEARVITDDISAVQRNEIFKKYRAGEIKVLISVDVLTAGFDAPICSSVFMFNTKSIIAYMQRAGRSLRPFKDKTHANIYYIGDTPSIESGIIEKMHRNAVQPKRKEDCKTIEELVEWNEDNEVPKDEPEYYHSVQVKKACKLAEKMNLTTLARLLNTQEFPEQFTGKLINGLQSFKAMTKDRSITPKQKAIVDKIIDPAMSATLSMNEASCIITSLTGRVINPTGNDAYIFQDGKYKGKHVKDAPWAYKRMVQRRFPNSRAAKAINAWHRAK